MAHSSPKVIKAVMVSVTYHRNCFIVTDGFESESLEELVRKQIRMPNDPLLDPSEWSEDEFTVLEIPQETLKLITKKVKYIKPSKAVKRK